VKAEVNFMSDNQKNMSQDQTAESSSAHAQPIKLSDIHSLDQLRGELGVQAHLLAAELKDRWQRLESDWTLLDVELQPLRTATTKATEDVSAAVKLLFTTLKEGYEDIKTAATPKH
jgi:hypothetical protein